MCGSSTKHGIQTVDFLIAGIDAIPTDATHCPPRNLPPSPKKYFTFLSEM